jgi:hypothetical protein
LHSIRNRKRKRKLTREARNALRKKLYRYKIRRAKRAALAETTAALTAAMAMSEDATAVRESSGETAMERLGTTSPAMTAAVESSGTVARTGTASALEQSGNASAMEWPGLASAVESSGTVVRTGTASAQEQSGNASVMEWSRLASVVESSGTVARTGTASALEQSGNASVIEWPGLASAVESSGTLETTGTASALEQSGFAIILEQAGSTLAVESSTVPVAKAGTVSSMEESKILTGQSISADAAADALVSSAALCCGVKAESGADTNKKKNGRKLRTKRKKAEANRFSRRRRKKRAQLAAALAIETERRAGAEGASDSSVAMERPRAPVYTVSAMESSSPWSNDNSETASVAVNLLNASALVGTGSSENASAVEQSGIVSAAEKSGIASAMQNSGTASAFVRSSKNAPKGCSGTEAANNVFRDTAAMGLGSVVTSGDKKKKRKEMRTLKYRQRRKARRALCAAEQSRTAAMSAEMATVDKGSGNPSIFEISSSASEQLETVIKVVRTLSTVERPVSIASERLKGAAEPAVKRPRQGVILTKSGTGNAMDVSREVPVPVVTSSGKAACENSVWERSQTAVVGRAKTAKARETLESVAKKVRLRAAQTIALPVELPKFDAIVERSGRAVVALANDELIVVDTNASFMTLLAAREAGTLSRQQIGKAILCLDVEVVSDGVYCQFSQIGCVLSVEGRISTFEAKVGDLVLKLLIKIMESQTYSL